MIRFKKYIVKKNKKHLKMAKDNGCTTRQEWSDLVENEERWPAETKKKMGSEQEYFCENKAHSSQGKTQLEETLQRLTSVMAEYRYVMNNVMTYAQETDDELRLVLKLIKANLEENRTESVLTKEEKERGKMEQRIMANLKELAQGQEAIKSELNHQSKAAEMTKFFEIMTLKRDQEKEKVVKPPLRCYWCHEEGHMKRNCPSRINRNRSRFERQIVGNQDEQATEFVRYSTNKQQDLYVAE